MNAVVVELKSGLAAVLSDDGCIVTIKNNDYEIGQVIQMNNTKIRFTKKIAVFAASAAAFVMISTGAWAYASPYTYVSVDVNPSIEFNVNRFDRVLHVKAVNDDGEAILKEISLSDLENKTIEDALTQTVKQMSEAGYFDGNIEGGIVITTSSKNEKKAEELAQELQQTAEEEVDENGDDVIVEAFSVGLERVEEAKELGVTPGKLNLVEKLQASAADPSTINLEEWLNKPVKEIMSATKENRKASVTTGSAINIDSKDSEKAKAAEEKAADKATKAEEKAKKDDAKTQEKITEKAENIDKKQIEIEEKAAKKAEAAKERAKAEAEKAAEKAKAIEEKAKAEVQKAAEKAKSTEEKAKVESQKNTEKAKDDVQDNTDGSDADENTDTDTSNNGSNKDTQNANGKQDNSNAGSKK